VIRLPLREPPPGVPGIDPACIAEGREVVHVWSGRQQLKLLVSASVLPCSSASILPCPGEAPC
jgi:hypothetical protein